MRDVDRCGARRSLVVLHVRAEHQEDRPMSSSGAPPEVLKGTDSGLAQLFVHGIDVVDLERAHSSNTTKADIGSQAPATPFLDACTLCAAQLNMSLLRIHGSTGATATAAPPGSSRV